VIDAFASATPRLPLEKHRLVGDIERA